MIRGQSPARHRVVLAIAAITLSVALVARVETQREWRDYAGGPDSSRFVAATQITPSQRAASSRWRGRYPAGQTDFNPARRARRRLRARPERTRSSRSMPRPARRSGSTRASRASTPAASTTGRARTARTAG